MGERKKTQPEFWKVKVNGDKKKKGEGGEERKSK